MQHRSSLRLLERCSDCIHTVLRGTESLADRGRPHRDSMISKWHLYKSSSSFHKQYICIKRAPTSPNHDSEWRCRTKLIKQNWILFNTCIAVHLPQTWTATSVFFLESKNTVMRFKWQLPCESVKWLSRCEGVKWVWFNLYAVEVTKYMVIMQPVSFR